jgi:hypothetical protein
VPDRILEDDFVERGAVVQFDEEGIADTAFRGLVIVDTELLVFDAVGLGTQGVNAWVGGGCVGTENPLTKGAAMTYEWIHKELNL